MKKALSGGLLGLFIGGVVMLFFSWISGMISLRLVPPRIESLEFTPQVALMLFQCLVTGTIAGSVTYLTERWGLGFASGIIVGYGLGFFFVRQDDQPWETIRAPGMLLPVVFAGALSSLAMAVLRMQESVSAEKNL